MRGIWLGLLGSSISIWAASGVLHTFKQRPGGIEPMTALAADTEGNLYGTTAYGGSKAAQCIRVGAGGCGTVFKLAPNGTGGFAWTQIYQFQGQPNDGAVPLGALVADAAGNLYGTTANGGTHNLGTVYELSPAAGSGWTEKV